MRPRALEFLSETRPCLATALDKECGVLADGWRWKPPLQSLEVRLHTQPAAAPNCVMDGAPNTTTRSPAAAAAATPAATSETAEPAGPLPPTSQTAAEPAEPADTARPSSAGVGSAAPSSSGVLVAVQPTAEPAPISNDVRRRHWAAPWSLLLHKDFKHETSKFAVSMGVLRHGGIVYLCSEKCRYSTSLTRCTVTMPEADSVPFLNIDIPYVFELAVDVIARHWDAVVVAAVAGTSAVTIPVDAYQLLWNKPQGTPRSATIVKLHKHLFDLQRSKPRIARRARPAGKAKPARSSASGGAGGCGGHTLDLEGDLDRIMSEPTDDEGDAADEYELQCAIGGDGGGDDEDDEEALKAEEARLKDLAEKNMQAHEQKLLATAAAAGALPAASAAAAAAAGLEGSVGGGGCGGDGGGGMGYGEREIFEEGALHLLRAPDLPHPTPPAVEEEIAERPPDHEYFEKWLASVQKSWHLLTDVLPALHKLAVGHNDQLSMLQITEPAYQDKCLEERL